MFLIVLRVIFVLLAFSVGSLVRSAFPEVFPAYAPWLVAALAAGIVAVEIVFQQRHLRVVVVVVIGLGIGMVVTAIVTGIMMLFVHEETLAARFGVIAPFMPLVGLFCCYLAVTIVLQTRDQFRFILPYMDFQNYGRPRGGLILDSSALVDGRVSALVDHGVVTEPVVVPEFVVRELHALADSADRLKRNRGRKGLDALLHIQGVAQADVRMDPTDYPEATGVDVKLVHLARDLDGRIATTDLNLAKVAMSEGAKVLNVADVSRSMRHVLLPGERITVRVSEPGEHRGQGRGYLPDGTMVVVEDARGDVGREIEVAITRPLESAGGRMYFAEKVPPRRENDGPGGQG